MTRAIPLATLLALALLSACDDGGGGPVTVTVARERIPVGQPAWGGGIAGITVVVTRADGSIGERGITDSDGRVQLAADAGAWITAATPAGSQGNPQFRLKTIADVEPGDELAFVVDGAGVPTTSLGTFMYSWQAVTPPASSIVSVTDRCGDHMIIPPASGNQVLVSLFDHCAGDSDVLYLAHGGPSIVASSLRPRIARAPGGSDAVAAWEPTAPRATRLDDLPAEVQTVTYFVAPVLGTRISTVAGHAGGVTNATPTNGAAEIALPWPAGVDDAFLHADLRHASGATQRLDVWTTGAIDASAGALLPWVTAAPTWDVGTRTVAWTETAGATPDATLVVGFYRSGDWQMLVPPGATTATFPPLPPELESMLTPSTNPLPGRVRHFDFARVDGYRAFRRLPEVAHDNLRYLGDRAGIDRALTSSSPGS